MESYHSGREKALTLLTILDNINCKYSCTITPREAFSGNKPGLGFTTGICG